jgi:hypothetical protein
MKIIVTIYTILCIIATGCNILGEKSEDGSSSIELKALGDMGFGADLYSCVKECYSKLVSKIDTNFVINNNEDYVKFEISASCLEITTWPSVDFDKNTLLAGIIISPTTCSRIVKQSLSLNPFDSKYTFMVTLEPGATQTPGAIFFWGVTNKLPADASITFQYRYNSIQ